MAANSLLAKFLPGGKLIHKMDSRKKEDLPRKETKSGSAVASNSSNDQTQLQSPPLPTLQHKPSSSKIQDLSNRYGNLQASHNGHVLENTSSNGYSPRTLSDRAKRIPSAQPPVFDLTDVTPQSKAANAKPAQAYHTTASRHVAGQERQEQALHSPIVVLGDLEEDDGIQYAPKKRAGLRTPKQNTSQKALENVNSLLDREFFLLQIQCFTYVNNFSCRRTSDHVQQEAIKVQPRYNRSCGDWVGR